MSMMRELTYFLGFQIKQDDKGISICQEKYTRDLLKKYEISNSSSVKTPMVPPNNLGPNLADKPINETLYRGMIRALMYLKGTPSLGMWYSKCLGFDLKGYSYSNYAGCNMDKKSTSGACQLLGGKLVCWSTKKQQIVAMCSAEAEYAAVVGEFWCIAFVVDLNSPIDDYVAHLLKDLSIKFFVKNGKTTLILNYKTFCQTTSLEYNNGNYVANPSTDEVKSELATIANHEALSQGLKAFGAPPQKGKRAKTKKSTLVQTIIQLTKEKVPSGDTDTSQSVLTGQITNPQDTKGNKQPTVKELPSTANEDICKSSPLSEAKPTDPENIKGNIQPTVKGLPVTNPDEGTYKTKPLPKGTTLNPKDSGRNIQLTDRTSFEVEPDIEPLILTTFGKIQALSKDSEEELKDESDEEMFKAGEEIDEEI
ncbi:hypothetical protein Tco_1184377 [Tanacetum coccineum]